MLTRENLHEYQRKAIQHLVDHNNAMLWLDMGLGKTVITLMAFTFLQDRWGAAAMLVVGPKRVVEQVWRQEAKKWKETGYLRFSLVSGDEAHRKRALSKSADIYLVNYENLEWLTTWVTAHWLNKGRYPPFDMIVYDEVTKVKNPEAKRSIAVQKILPFTRRRVGLTGEPAANGYKDLFGQYYAVDQGKRLGTRFAQFRDAFLTQVNRRYVISHYGKEQIKRRVHDITMEMAADDYLDLPPVIDRDLFVDLPPQARRVYDDVEQKFFAELKQGGTIEAQTEATKGMKCLQISGGACYINQSDAWEEIHSAKLDALEDLLEEQGGQPVLLAYAFRHERPRIQKRFPEAEFLSSEMPEKEFDRIHNAWNRGNIPLLCGHPASMGHGLNLQFGGDTLCWYGLNWSLELYDQFNARLAGGHRRRGRISLFHILARDTMDEAVKIALDNKAKTQADLRRAVNLYRASRLGLRAA